MESMDPLKIRGCLLKSRNIHGGRVEGGAERKSNMEGQNAGPCRSQIKEDCYYASIQVVSLGGPKVRVGGIIVLGETPVGPEIWEKSQYTLGERIKEG